MRSKRLSMNIRRTRRNFLAVFGALILSACASGSADLRDEEPDMSSVRCANGEPLTCVEKIGQKISCTCEGRRDLERITRNGLRNW